MPKVLKLKTINKDNVENLNSRGIKSSMNDPIKLVQKTLDKLYNHMLFFIEREFLRLFGALSPSVTGVSEAIERIKKSKTGNWGTSIEMEGDFGDLYSNCNKKLLKSCIIKAGKIAKLERDSVDYIIKLMECSMSHSYFHEPQGIFKTLEGFSMGDNSAARGSELILRVFELDIYKSIYDRKLNKHVNRYLRFRDDVSIHLTGEPEKMLKIMKIVITGYPKCIQFNVESRLIFGKFLNIKIFNFPGQSKPTTTVLRKASSKYDIIPFNSNISAKYKMMAGLHYFNTNKTHTSSIRELSNQNQIVKTILQEKGFPENEIRKIRKVSKKRPEKQEKKKYIGTTVFDNVSKRHVFVKNVFKNSKLDKDTYYLPAEIPGRKLEQFIFSIRKMRNQLEF